MAKNAQAPHQARGRVGGRTTATREPRDSVLEAHERERIRADAKAEADRLRACGWTKQDFAEALAEFLDETQPQGARHVER